MARSTRLVILIKNIYTLWGRKRFLLPVTYFPTNLVYPFTLRVTGIKIHHEPLSNYEIVKTDLEDRQKIVLSQLAKDFPPQFNEQLALCTQYSDIFGLETESITPNNFYKQKLRLIIEILIVNKTKFNKSKNSSMMNRKIFMG